jgi:hypothetical protein
VVRRRYGAGPVRIDGGIAEMAVVEATAVEADIPLSIRADPPAVSPERPRLLAGRVVAAVVLQVVGYAALLVLFPHADPTSVVEALSGVPAVILIPLAVPAIPATLLALSVGAVTTAAGLPPQSIPAVLLASGDVYFYASAVVVAVTAAWVQDRLSQVR